MTSRLLVAAAAAIIGLGSLAGTGGSIGSASAETVKKSAPKAGGKAFAARPGPRSAPVARRGGGGGGGGRNVAIGAAVIAGTIIAAGAANARRGYRGEGLSCSALERRCDDGQDWACRRLDEREDC